jgi:hypothetical protein
MFCQSNNLTVLFVTQTKVPRNTIDSIVIFRSSLWQSSGDTVFIIAQHIETKINASIRSNSMDQIDMYHEL